MSPMTIQPCMHRRVRLAHMGILSIFLVEESHNIKHRPIRPGSTVLVASSVQLDNEKITLNASALPNAQDTPREGMPTRRLPMEKGMWRNATAAECMYCNKVRHEQGPQGKTPKNIFKHPWIVQICHFYFPRFFLALFMSESFCNTSDQHVCYHHAQKPSAYCRQICTLTIEIV